MMNETKNDDERKPFDEGDIGNAVLCNSQELKRNPSNNLGVQNPDCDLKASCTERGWVFELNGRREGPFSLKEKESDGFNFRLAAQFGVEPKAVLKAILSEYRREMSISELNTILASTVKHEEAAKAVTFLGMLLAQTDEDQFNIAFQAESTTGKTYIPQEIVEYFPSQEKRIYAGASPTSFFHGAGRWIKLTEIAGQQDLTTLFDSNELSDEKRQVILVDLEGKILIFLDQPHWMLQERLRPLLSHDRKMLRYDITDKTGRGGLRTKTVIIKGYPTVILATAKPTQEDQERTRMWLLSPQVDQKKLISALSLSGEKVGDREAFKEWRQSHPTRRWLINRILQIRATEIKNIVIPQREKILQRFMKKRKHLTPRSQRDYPRLLCLIKGIALLNCFNRPQPNPGSITVNESDIETGFELYEALSTPNELGLSPETYRIYEEIIKPTATCNDDQGITRKDIIQKHWELYGRPISEDRLRRQILPALESAGIIYQDANPHDKRQTMIYCTVISPISETTDEKASEAKILQEYGGKNSVLIQSINTRAPGRFQE